MVCQLGGTLVSCDGLDFMEFSISSGSGGF